MALHQLLAAYGTQIRPSRVDGFYRKKRRHSVVALQRLPYTVSAATWYIPTSFVTSAAASKPSERFDM